ncbi:MAG: UvrD-helicase domain-containing protein, partial [Candidatus Thiodiazotropha endolucinida]|nr:UvrD-helicase domain-containing protein [Candidatus Thiodiazotropha taylori]MCW4241345.1 UvrD-helicase domain-containing protein [Candidatus Thiodiazotropha taylori]
MSDLNPRQQQAVNYIDTPLLVLAGAGSGKTRVITTKISYLIKRCGLNPQQITA